MMDFMAKYCSSLRRWTACTLPKPPRPSTRQMVKWDRSTAVTKQPAADGVRGEGGPMGQARG